MRFSKAPHDDVTQKMAHLQQIICRKSALSDFIVCTEIPQLRHGRVRLYDENGNRGRRRIVGLFTAALLETSLAARLKKTAVACAISIAQALLGAFSLSTN